MTQEILIQELMCRYRKLVENYIDQPEAIGLSRTELLAALQGAAQEALEDVGALVSRDPAAQGNSLLVERAYRSFHAVAVYRLTHRLWVLADKSKVLGQTSPLHIEVRAISERMKSETGIEIHPAAKIGPRLVIDHGYNVVIGETAEIGEDCTILNNVVIGALGIANNPTGRRHPRIGNCVEIAGNVRILGPLTIGDNARINAGSQVVCNIPEGGKVSVITTLQIQRGPQRVENPAELLSIVDDPRRPGTVFLLIRHGRVTAPEIVCAETFAPHEQLNMRVISQKKRPWGTAYCSRFLNLFPAQRIKKFTLRLFLEDGQELLISECPALSRAAHGTAQDAA